MRALTAILIIAILVAAGFFVFIYSGVYNVAASQPHFGPVRWVLKTTMRNSVRAHAEDVQTPPLAKQDREKGFEHFDKVCIICHGAPGIPPSEIGTGLRPKPPDLSKSADDMTAAELYWVTQHGLKFTGMASFGKTHTEEDIWNIVAFLKDLPEISREQYMQLREKLNSGSSGHRHQSRRLPYPRSNTRQRFMELRQAI